MEPTPPPDAVLFACNYNVVRSPMAAALMRELYGARVFVDSCGLRAGDQPDPFVAAVLEEIGVDLSRHEPKSFDELEDGSFDLVVSLTPQAQHRAVEMSRGRAVDIEYWPTADPTLEGGARAQRLEAYRQLRDALKARLIARFGPPGAAQG